MNVIKEQLQTQWNEIRRLDAMALLAEPRRTFVNLILERYWNNGSPSGFTQSVSDHYAPQSDMMGFYLPFRRFRGEECTVIGQPLDFMKVDMKGNTPLPDYFVPIHPDLVEVDDIQIKTSENVIGIPTASGRTLAIFEMSNTEFFAPVHFKLHYPRRLGRYSRDLYHFKWFASVESSLSLIDYEKQAEVHVHFPENRGMFIEPMGQRGFGYLMRTQPDDCNNECLHIPYFSLFAEPPSGSTSILIALEQCFNIKPEELFRLIVLGLVDLY